MGPGKSVHYRGCSHFRGVHFPRFHCITVNGVIVPVLNEPVGNLGAVFDPKMNMSACIKSY